MSTGYSLAKDKIRVLLLEGIHRSAVTSFREWGYTNVVSCDRKPGREELLSLVSDAHVIGIRSRTQLRAEVLSRARKLFAIGCFCIGTNQVDCDTAENLGIPVFNAPHASTRSVAELVVGLTIMLMRNIFPRSWATHRGMWMKTAHDSYECRGHVLGIVGYGHIGSQVSILAEALGMKVVYYDIETKLSLGNATPLSSLDEVLRRADVVTLHVPETPLTRDMIGPAQLDRMRPGACLVNASRGSVVDVEALAERLASHHLRGAAVDVFPREPRSGEEELISPLRGLEQVILTPHIGGSTMEAQESIGREVAAKLITYSDRGSTMGAVNFPQLNLVEQENTHRILHIHRNQPGVLKQINTILAEEGINILGQHLQTRPGVGYVVFDIERKGSRDLLKKLKGVDSTIRARILY